jgi:hypothetical protein
VNIKQMGDASEIGRGRNQGALDGSECEMVYVGAVYARQLDCPPYTLYFLYTNNFMQRSRAFQGRKSSIVNVSDP